MLKEEAFTPENALKQLQDKQRQQEMNNMSNNSRNPFNDPNRSTAGVIGQMEQMTNDGREYMQPYPRTDQFNPHLAYASAPGTDLTPVQASIHNQGIDHQNWQTPGSAALYPGRGFQEAPLRRDQSPQNNESSAVRFPKTEEEVIRNRAETQMTSNMIKNSLAELREKLTKMKHNKEIVTVGMKALDE